MNHDFGLRNGWEFSPRYDSSKSHDTHMRTCVVCGVMEVIRILENGYVDILDTQVVEYPTCEDKIAHDVMGS